VRDFNLGRTVRHARVCVRACVIGRYTHVRVYTRDGWTRNDEERGMARDSEKSKSWPLGEIL